MIKTMKKGQIMSHVFIYIFAVIVIGLILLFGFKYINKIIKTGCEVETLDLVNDMKSEAREIRSLSYGSSYSCSFVFGSGGKRCEFVIPDNVVGVCFVDPAKGQFSSIPFSDVKQFAEGLGAGANRNVFFSVPKGANCKADPALIPNLKIDSPICIDVKKPNSFILENKGDLVEVKIS